MRDIDFQVREEDLKPGERVIFMIKGMIGQFNGRVLEMDGEGMPVFELTDGVPSLKWKLSRNEYIFLGRIMGEGHDDQC